MKHKNNYSAKNENKNKVINNQNSNDMKQEKVAVATQNAENVNAAVAASASQISVAQYAGLEENLGLCVEAKKEVDRQFALKGKMDFSNIPEPMLRAAHTMTNEFFTISLLRGVERVLHRRLVKEERIGIGEIILAITEANDDYWLEVFGREKSAV